MKQRIEVDWMNKEMIRRADAIRTLNDLFTIAVSEPELYAGICNRLKISADDLLHRLSTIISLTEGIL